MLRSPAAAATRKGAFAIPGAMLGALRGAVLRECGELRAMPRALQEQAFDAAMRAVGRLGAACKGGKSDRSPKGSGGRSKNKPLAFRRVR